MDILLHVKFFVKLSNVRKNLQKKNKYGMIYESKGQSSWKVKKMKIISKFT